MNSDDVFDFEARKGEASTMSDRAYVGLLTLFVCGGLIGSAVCATFTYNMQVTLWWLIPYFGLAIPGIIISAKSDNWLISLIGYIMVVISTGAITGPFVAQYELDSVRQIAFLTLAISTAIGLGGMLYPKSVAHWGGFLLIGLWLIILGDVVRIFMTWYGVPVVTLQWIDYAAVALFSAFIFYDMNRAMGLPKTMDNAVDCAVALYLDILNLFIRLMKLYGQKKG